MPPHICPKCGKKFDKKTTYSYHIIRKIPCVPLESEIGTLKERIKELENINKTQKEQIENLAKLLGSLNR